MEFVRKNAPGILICLVIAVPALAAGPAVRGGGRPGVRHPHRHGDRPVLEGSGGAKSGITYTSKKILQLAVVLLGFGMNLGSVLQVGDSHCPSSSPPSPPA